MFSLFIAAYILLAGLCFDVVICTAGGQQNALKSAKDRAKILAACPAYEHYARFLQYVSS